MKVHLHKHVLNIINVVRSLWQVLVINIIGLLLKNCKNGIDIFGFILGINDTPI